MVSVVNSEDCIDGDDVDPDEGTAGESQLPRKVSDKRAEKEARTRPLCQAPLCISTLNGSWSVQLGSKASGKFFSVDLTVVRCHTRPVHPDFDFYRL